MGIYLCTLTKYQCLYLSVNANSVSVGIYLCTFTQYQAVYLSVNANSVSVGDLSVYVNSVSGCVFICERKLGVGGGSIFVRYLSIRLCMYL